METKIKKMELDKAGEHKTVKVTFEKGAKEYTFIAKALDVVDEERFKGLLKYWTEKAIPEREIEEGMTNEAIEEKLAEIVAPKVKK